MLANDSANIRTINLLTEDIQHWELTSPCDKRSFYCSAWWVSPLNIIYKHCRALTWSLNSSGIQRCNFYAKHPQNGAFRNKYIKI